MSSRQHATAQPVSSLVHSFQALCMHHKNDYAQQSTSHFSQLAHDLVLKSHQQLSLLNVWRT